MKILKIADLKPSDFSQNNIAYPSPSDPPVWSSGTSYGAGDRVYYGYDIYEAVQANTGVQPDTDDGTNWKKVGMVNAYKFLDDYVNTQAEATNADANNVYDITVTFRTSQWHGVAVLNCDGKELYLVQKSTDGTEIFTDVTINLDYSYIDDWWDYFTLPFFLKKDVYINILPYQSDVTIIITKDNSPAKIGVIAAGTEVKVGDTLYQPTLGIIDYSKKDTDEYGNILLKQGNWAKRNSYQFVFHNLSLDHIYRSLADIRGKKTVFIGNNDSISYETLIVYGFYRDFYIYLSGPTHSIGNIEIEGLV